MLIIDGSRHSGSGTIVRQAVAFSALTGQAVPMVNARRKRDRPGLRPQHIRVVEAVAELVNGRAEGLTPGSQEFTFRTGAVRRSAESIGQHVATQLLQDLASGATLDRFAADQTISFAALASGESRFLIPSVTDHVLTSGWLGELFLHARVKIEGQRLVITGVGFWPRRNRRPG